MADILVLEVDDRAELQRRLEESERDNARLLVAYAELSSDHSRLLADYKVAEAYLADIALFGDPLATTARRALEHLAAKPTRVVAAEAAL